MNSSSSSASPQRRTALAIQIRATIKELSGIAIDSDTTSFMELGFDSLFLTQASQAFQGNFGVKITFRQMLSELNTVEMLAQYPGIKIFSSRDIRRCYDSCPHGRCSDDGGSGFQ